MIELILLALAPSVALVILFYLRDKHEKEPIKLLVKVFVLGAVAIVPIAFLEMWIFKFFGIDPLHPASLGITLVSNLFIVGVIE